MPRGRDTPGAPRPQTIPTTEQTRETIRALRAILRADLRATHPPRRQP